MSMSANDDTPLREEATEAFHDAVDGVDPYINARELIRLIQCAECSRPLRSPVRLPCGNSICRSCLPSAHKRENITYPLTEGRDQGFYCPFPKDGNARPRTFSCGLEHAVGDCGVDVTLTKAIQIFENAVQETGTPEIGNQETRLVVNSSDDSTGLCDTKTLPVSFRGSRLVATYNLAATGGLPYNADVTYSTKGEDKDAILARMDRQIFGTMKTTLRDELDCQVCYSLILDPCTMACGHTFCRTCVARVLDHSTLCPICRRKLPISVFAQSEQKNARLDSLIEAFFPAEYASRSDTARLEELGGPDETNVPLFVCTLSFPSTRTFLHVFEPRYRLMIRRTIQSGSRKFGMVAINRSRSPQGELGSSIFMQYGTMLEIDRFDMLPDGRSLISTTGLYKFKVVQSSMRDGYHVGRIERVDDISITEEENLEARETSSARIEVGESLDNIDSLSTQQLFSICKDFARKRRAEGAPWLHDRVLAAYGRAPRDPATFPYWLASILPIREEERYALLPATSVRERLKITAKWAKKLESSELYVLCSLIAPSKSSVRDANHYRQQDIHIPNVGYLMTRSLPLPRTFHLVSHRQLF